MGKDEETEIAVEYSVAFHGLKLEIGK